MASRVAPEEAVLSSPRRKLRNLLRPWGPCPYHLPPQNQSPGPPLPSPCTPPPPQGLLFIRVRNVKNMKQVAKFAPSLGPVPLPPTPPEPKPLDPPSRALVPPPHPTGYPSKKIIFLLFVRGRNVAKFAPSLGPVPLPPTPPAPKPLDPPLPSPCTPPHPTGYPSKKIIFLLFVRVRNGPCPYHLPPRHRSPWTPPPEPQPRAQGWA